MFPLPGSGIRSDSSDGDGAGANRITTPSFLANLNPGGRNQAAAAGGGGNLGGGNAAGDTITYFFRGSSANRGTGNDPIGGGSNATSSYFANLNQQNPETVSGPSTSTFLSNINQRNPQTAAGPSTSSAFFLNMNQHNPEASGPVIQSLPYARNLNTPMTGVSNPISIGTPPNLTTASSTSSRIPGTSMGDTPSSESSNVPGVRGVQWQPNSMFRTPICQAPRRLPNSSTLSSATSGMSTTTNASTSSSSRGGGIEPIDRSTIVAIVEGRGQARGEIGLACMNVNTPTLILSQLNDTQSFHRVITKINIFRPYEILMCATACDVSNPSRLYLQLMKEVTNIKIIPIQRRIFNEAKGMQMINSLVAEEYFPIVHTITNKYYCLAATHALLKYVELVQSTVFSPRTIRVDFQGCDETCMIDHITAQHLELLQNNQHAGSHYCLFGILNSCKTPNGARLLRMNILQPSCDIKVINSRLDSVESLMKNPEMLNGVQDVLGRLPIDIERVIAFLIQIPKTDNSRISEQRLNDVIALKHILELVPKLASVLEESENDYFQSVRTNLTMPQFDIMLQRIKRTIQDEAHFQKGSMNMKRQRCFAVKSDINPILDIARKAYCELVDDINKYVSELSNEVGLHFRLGTNTQRGFFIQLLISNRNDEIPPLPSYFLQVRKRGNVVTFTTELLISIDHRTQEVLKEIENLSSIVISELITEIRSEIGILYKASEAIGNLDLIYSLAHYALTTPRCARPEFLPDTTSIKMGRHPVLDSISADPTVPNNTFLADYANFMLITGPNMSGKTTYLKHVACLQVMAQVGSFVPADAASFRISSNIMSRIGTGDNIEENSSSFALEMTEMTYILQNATDNSLIIIDELGRATSVEEGAAISWAIAEELLKKTSFILFATHHMLLTKLESHYINVLNFTMETEEWEDTNAEASIGPLPSSKLQYMRTIKRGVTDVEYYGLKLAMNSCYPPQIIADAIKMSREIMALRGIEQTSNENDEMNRRRTKFLLGMHLGVVADSFDLDMDEEDMDPETVESIRNYLESLQQEFRRIL